MNAKERILTALTVRQPDRVPLYIHGINEAPIIGIGRHLTDGLPEARQFHEMTDSQKIKLVDTLFLIHEAFGVDGITTFEIGHERELDDRHVVNDWGIIYRRSPHGLPVAKVHPLADVADLDGYTALMTWLPSYFQRMEDLSMGRAATKGGLLMLLAIVGAPLGGFLTDRWMKRRQNARLLFPAISSATIAVLLIAFGWFSGPVQYALLMGAGISAVAFVPGAVAVTQDVVHGGSAGHVAEPARHRSAYSGQHIGPARHRSPFRPIQPGNRHDVFAPVRAAGRGPFLHRYFFSRHRQPTGRGDRTSVFINARMRWKG
jgi:uncharacterized membrane protein YeaQ/YmgE (transglycosylase-associated protein family)